MSNGRHDVALPCRFTVAPSSCARKPISSFQFRGVKKAQKFQGFTFLKTPKRVNAWKQQPPAVRLNSTHGVGGPSTDIIWRERFAMHNPHCRHRHCQCTLGNRQELLQYGHRRALRSAIDVETCELLLSVCLPSKSQVQRHD